ncbi:threonine synthase [Chelativorans sp. M5D2P16]|uniref:threonine synthase n=1 Tax=Chelativorans sp. M5D2P16 TaxID=3095678 RepID=UPI002ACA59A4|nr:threonine synthase [Chelativorans sp. M5D2P16]MDZ5698818.1 threonine synthase [Chelativorans sp. M5D2P16]
MDYVSTRGEAPALGFSDALLQGLARDGGLYLPSEWPRFSAEEIRAMRGLSYAETAFTIIRPFIGGEISEATLKRIIDDSYATFRHAAVCPLVQTGPAEFVLELFHGPTLAFKDVAMQLLARLMDHVLGERGARMTIAGATSGDTGGAAIHAFAGVERADIFILFPQGRVSPVQQRQMTTSGAANVQAIAIEGNFDDCQGLVKAMFNDHAFRDAVLLSGVNSINWARIMAQIVYYFTAAVSLGAPDRPVSFTVPTGNFGDIFAGYAAKLMGLPIARLLIATNENDILARTLADGEYATCDVVATTSPSMDIQVSSNFERLLFEASGRNAAEVRGYMDGLRQSGSFTVSEATLARIRTDFTAGRAGIDETAATIRETLEKSGYLADPHTATALTVARDRAAGEETMVVLATAHPAKFPQAVKDACGLTPALPDWLEGLMEKQEDYTILPSDLKMVEDHVRRHSRAGV